MSDLDLNFMHEVANTPRGRGVLLCIRCGRCSNSCPIARPPLTTIEFNPRRLMEMVILGFRSEVLLHELPWYCLSCFTCLDKCPQGGDVGEVMFAVKNLAVREGNVPAEVVERAKILVKTGRIVNPVRSLIDKREKWGLPKIHPSAIKDVQKIAKRTGLDKKLAFKWDY